MYIYIYIIYMGSVLYIYIFTHIWLVFMVNVCKILNILNIIHGSYANGKKF